MTIKDWIYYFLNKRSFWVGLLALAILATGFGLKPAYRSFKAWRAQQIHSVAQELIEEEAYIRGFERAQAAVLLDPSKVEALRHLADLAVRFGHPSAYRYCELVLKSEQAEDADWARSVDAALQAQATKQAFDYLNEWRVKLGAQTDAFALREAKAFLAIDNYALALEILLSAKDSHPSSSELRSLYLALLNFIGTTPAIEDAAAQILATSTSSADDLEWVYQQGKLAVHKRLQAIETLLSQPDLEMGNRIRYLLIGYRLGNDTAARGITSLSTEITSGDEETLASYTTALCEIGAYALVLTLVPEAIDNRILQRNRLFASIETEQLEEAFAYSALDRSQRLTSVAEETLLRALAFQKAGDTYKYKNSIQQSIAAAEGSDLPFLAQQFQRLGYTDTLLELYERFAADKNFGYRLLPIWQELALATQNETSLERCLKHLKPEDLNRYTPQERASLLYYCLIFDIQGTIAIQKIETLASVFAHDPSFRAILALSQWRKGDLLSAKTLIEDLSGETEGRVTAFAKALILNKPLTLGNAAYLDAELKLLQ